MPNFNRLQIGDVVSYSLFFQGTQSHPVKGVIAGLYHLNNLYGELNEFCTIRLDNKLCMMHHNNRDMTTTRYITANVYDVDKL